MEVWLGVASDLNYIQQSAQDTLDYISVIQADYDTAVQ